MKINFIHKTIALLFVVVLMGGCYSFTGGSVPEHLKTIVITNVNDVSNYGNAAYRDRMTQLLIEKFKRDNSMSVVDKQGDAKLYVTIKSISDAPVTVTVGQLEKERKITVMCDYEFYDVVKKKTLSKSSVSNFGIYELKDAMTARDEAIKKILEQSADDILFAVVSGW